MMHGRVHTGQTVDGFLIGELIHQGGMSTLRAVTRPDIDTPILMKVPKILEGMDPAAIVSFEMEQMILPRVSGVHVPKFFAAGDFAVQPYIVMEHVPGKTLLHKLDDLPLPYEEVAAIGTKVATAIHDLHRQRVIHFDVKPSNILFRATGEAVLIDFGLSRHEQLPDLMAEEFRIPYGTGPYLAPEQILGVRKDPRSDLFALGVLLYFFSTGTRPFGDPKSKRQLHKRLWRDPVPPRKLRPDYPLWLQEIVLRCLEIDPARRHPSAGQLAFDLSHPGQVKLTVRSERLKRDPWTVAIRRRFNPHTEELVVKSAATATHVSTAPIVAIALDLSEGSEALAEALRETVQRGLERLPDARFAILNVLKQHRIALDQKLDQDGQNKHLMRLVELRHWAQKLDVAAHRISFHVLESPDPAAAIIDYAETNAVDQIVLGARTNSMLRTILGSISAEVAAKAPCTVTVVRPRRRVSGADESSKV
jgi:non-specific serine/threonine protein kinase/protein-serine/threonine kinase